MVITKKQAVEAFDNKAYLLAKALGVTPGRISQFNDDDPLPDNFRRHLQYELKPEVFNKTNQ